MSASYTLDAKADKGFADASSYDQHRPTYPAPVTAKFLEQLKLDGFTGARVVDLAAGTGKFTEGLAGRPEGFEITAVEPHVGMRGELERKNLQGVTVVDGFAEKMPLEDGWADAVVVGQAFHWFATTEALKEIHRVLKPQGTLGLIWNIEEYNKPASWPATTAWEQDLNDLVFETGNDGPTRFRNETWKNAFEDQVAANPIKTVAKYVVPGAATADDDKFPLFSMPLGEDTVPFTVWLTPEALLQRLQTLSQFSAMEGEEKQRMVQRFEQIMGGESVEKNGEGEVALHGKTYFAWTTRM